MNSSVPIDQAQKLDAVDLSSSDRFINRELSWISFNSRVLEEAENTAHPLLERLRFLSISGSNLDEFYMVRVAGLWGQVHARVATVSPDGLTPAQALEQVDITAGHLMDKQQQVWKDLLELMEAEGIHLVLPGDLTKADKKWLQGYFEEQIFPILTPMAIDPSHPFPFIQNLGFGMILEMAGRKNEPNLKALIPFPNAAHRFVRLPGDEIRFISLESIVTLYLDKIFPGYKVLGSGLFRLIRDSDIEIEEEAEDLVRLYETALKRRRRGSVIRLKVNQEMPESLRKLLIEEIDIDNRALTVVDGILGISQVSQMITEDRPDLLFQQAEPRYPERVREAGGNVFQAISIKDFVVHHPYESFDVVVQFLKQAARDPDVVAIKHTLYRTSSDSPIVKALIEAAEAGKSVTALIELKARFDEEANIRWARDLERAGAQVIYGFVDLKTHAKVSVAVRREGQSLKSYMHFGTGNYHPNNARIYSDLSMFTDDQDLAKDVTLMFNYITGYSKPENMSKLYLSPYNLREALMEMIEKEIDFVKKGKPGAIWAKLNSLVDPEIIDALYKASNAGVNIRLVVRGICCLRPGVKGMSENIQVRSIIGRFLEHSRMVCFGNGAGLPSPEARVFLSSADWMPRNLNRRIETLVPVTNETIHRQVLDQIMVACIKDNQQTWILEADGTYTRLHDDQQPFSAHNYFLTNPSLSGRGKALKVNMPVPDLTPPV
ncbi:RNA degradosome polyphosphate kinase [Sneathiella limimaris]|uniref:RNA degradosome polyphosphate kinase n=1 Tax=Sneathiella limimaris TaxID=1964213 RepID=UPI00146DE789|nr:RNA degradosome polyphosphate kinase [Sneathiella limimaris]